MPAILDPNRGGHWRIRPAQDGTISRRYLDRTNVLETRFSTSTGTIALTDFMAVASKEQKGERLWPEHELVRQIECEEGEVELTVDFRPRLAYGRTNPTLKNCGRLGWRIDLGRSVLILRSEIDLVRREHALLANFTLKAGGRMAFSFSYSAEAPAVIPALGEAIEEKLNLTVECWRRWAAQSNYRGPYERQLTRSALALKLLSYAPSGAITAAPTTSLPEFPGGDLNWDYRFAWLRDAAFTVHALFGLGYKEDGAAFVDWLLHATRLTRPKLRVLYDVFGKPRRGSRNSPI